MSVLLASASSCGGGDGVGADEDAGGSTAIDAHVEAPRGEDVFVLRIENVAGPAFSTSLSPGLWVLHEAPEPLFTEGEPDRGRGLEALAEDGDPSALAAALQPEASGVFDRPSGAAGRGPLAPGDVYEIPIPGHPERPHLTFVTMVMESNDVFLAPRPEGIPLYDADGRTLPDRDVTDRLLLWNAGTEADEPPGAGVFQPARQPRPNTGPREGVIRSSTASTRALPLARDLMEIDVEEADGVFALTLRNVSEARGALVTNLSELFWVLHDGSHRLFEVGAPDLGRGLEALAEMGNARPLVTDTEARPGVAATDVHSRDASGGLGPLAPGQAYTLTLAPDADHPYVTLASSVEVTNDAFLSFPPGGIRLLDESGAPRAARAIAEEMRSTLVVWDAGTEANQTPGAGSEQGVEAGAVGSPDLDRAVRRYHDMTNDLAGPGAGGFVDVSVRHLRGATFEVRIENTSGSTPFRGMVTAFIHALHDGRGRLFEPGGVATPGMIALAEDCKTDELAGELVDAGYGGVGVAYLPDGSPPDSAGGPLRPGYSYTFEVTADATHRWLDLAAMPYPSNDMLVAYAPPGLELLDEHGAPRSGLELAASARMLLAWDAGTEANQAGAAGRDQVPLQSGLGVGPDEGDGTVRSEADPVWSYPAPRELVRVTIARRR